ncbi:hypothetical protein DL96DRAFT_1621789 [Flagelloscypha sp. PMI_526]|nr:hypothetical protein DL96DRAFT_1621789 [Flagelloscypha sp. PMI_526]
MHLNFFGSLLIAAIILWVVLPVESNPIVETPSSTWRLASITVRWHSDGTDDPGYITLKLEAWEQTGDPFSSTLAYNITTSAGSALVTIPDSCPDGYYFIEATNVYSIKTYVYSETDKFWIGSKPVEGTTTKTTTTTSKHSSSPSASSSLTNGPLGTTIVINTTVVNGVLTTIPNTIPNVLTSTTPLGTETTALPAVSPSTLSLASSKPPTGTIIAGVIGGLAFLLFLGLLAWYIGYRRNKQSSRQINARDIPPPTMLTKDPYTQATQMQGPFNSLTTAAQQKQALALPSSTPRGERIAQLEAEIGQLRGQDRIAQLEDELRQLRTGDAAASIAPPAYH